MPYFLKGNCVHKGTKEEPGELVKCHDTHEEALAHLKALYVHVEDADKGGPGSGWHNPPEGTHTAENAPNFAGGPGADRKYGVEEEKPPKGSKRCKCPKCGSVRTLPKGAQCEDIECSSCGSRMAQEKPREDKPAAGEAGGKKAVHGEGSMLGEVTAVMGQEGKAECKCPHCGKAIPCTAKACPYCKEKIDRVNSGEGEKVLETAYVPATGTVYKSADGTWRWASLCNWAVVDREREVVSEKAYQDGMHKAQKTGQYGELDLVHVGGTDVGDCDMLFTTAKEGEPPKLGAGGPWYETPMAVGARQAVQDDPDYWGMSIKFRYNPERRVHGIYMGDIELLKYTILPKAMAASYGTAIAVQGGKAMKELDEKTREALALLNLSEEEIAELSEKQKALPPEENVAEKDETPKEEVEEVAVEPEQGKVKQWLTQALQALGGGTTKAEEDTPVASAPEEAGKVDKVTDPANAAGPAETKQAGGESDEADGSEVLQAFGTEMAKSLGALVQNELATRDEQIAELVETVKVLRDEVATATKSAEEQVEEALRNIPPVVTVTPSQVQATVQSDGPPKGLTFGQRPEVAEKHTGQLLESIERLVNKEMKGAKYKA